MAKAKTPHNRSGNGSEAMDVDIPRYSAYATRTPRHRQSMDILPIPEEPSSYYVPTSQ